MQKSYLTAREELWLFWGCALMFLYRERRGLTLYVEPRGRFGEFFMRRAGLRSAQ